MGSVNPECKVHIKNYALYKLYAETDDQDPTSHLSVPFGEKDIVIFMYSDPDDTLTNVSAEVTFPFNSDEDNPVAASTQPTDYTSTEERSRDRHEWKWDVPDLGFGDYVATPVGSSLFRQDFTATADWDELTDDDENPSCMITVDNSNLTIYKPGNQEAISEADEEDLGAFLGVHAPRRKLVLDVHSIDDWIGLWISGDVGDVRVYESQTGGTPLIWSQIVGQYSLLWSVDNPVMPYSKTFWVEANQAGKEANIRLSFDPTDPGNTPESLDTVHVTSGSIDINLTSPTTNETFTPDIYSLDVTRLPSNLPVAWRIVEPGPDERGNLSISYDDDGYCHLTSNDYAGEVTVEAYCPEAESEIYDREYLTFVNVYATGDTSAAVYDSVVLSGFSTPSGRDITWSLTSGSDVASFTQTGDLAIVQGNAPGQVTMTLTDDGTGDTFTMTIDFRITLDLEVDPTVIAISETSTATATVDPDLIEVDWELIDSYGNTGATIQETTDHNVALIKPGTSGGVVTVRATEGTFASVTKEKEITIVKVAIDTMSPEAVVPSQNANFVASREPVWREVEWKLIDNYIGATIVSSGTTAAVSSTTAGTVIVRAYDKDHPTAYDQRELDVVALTLDSISPNPIAAGSSVVANANLTPLGRSLTWELIGDDLGTTVAGQTGNTAVITAGSSGGTIEVQVSTDVTQSYTISDTKDLLIVDLDLEANTYYQRGVTGTASATVDPDGRELTWSIQGDIGANVSSLNSLNAQVYSDQTGKANLIVADEEAPYISESKEVTFVDFLLTNGVAQGDGYLKLNGQILPAGETDTISVTKRYGPNEPMDPYYGVSVQTYGNTGGVTVLLDQKELFNLSNNEPTRNKTVYVTASFGDLDIVRSFNVAVDTSSKMSTGLLEGAVQLNTIGGEGQTVNLSLPTEHREIFSHLRYSGIPVSGKTFYLDRALLSLNFGQYTDPVFSDSDSAWCITEVVANHEYSWEEGQSVSMLSPSGYGLARERVSHKWMFPPPSNSSGFIKVERLGFKNASGSIDDSTSVAIP